MESVSPFLLLLCQLASPLLEDESIVDRLSALGHSPRDVQGWVRDMLEEHSLDPIHAAAEPASVYDEKQGKGKQGKPVKERDVDALLRCVFKGTLEPAAVYEALSACSTGHLARYIMQDMSGIPVNTNRWNRTAS
jgi:hypothetical protein